MTRGKILAVAKKMGIDNSSKLNNTDLIRTIQSKEGNSSCFASGAKDCDQAQCCWRENCMK